MATGNFTYENRIIVITDDDYECENLPILGEWDNDINGRVVHSVDDFIFWKVLATSGYYSDGCISYYKRDIGEIINHYLGYTFRLDSKRQIAEELTETFGFVSPNTLRKKANGTKNLEDALCEMIEYLAKLEEQEVNKQLDRLKQAYCYSEYGCIGNFSNGEALYQKIG